MAEKGNLAEFVIWLGESKKGTEYMNIVFNDGLRLVGFLNEKKEKGSNQPDWRIFYFDEDEEKFVPVGAAWERQTKKKKDYFYFKIEMPEGEVQEFIAHPNPKKGKKQPDFIAFKAEAVEKEEKKETKKKKELVKKKATARPKKEEAEEKEESVEEKKSSSSGWKKRSYTRKKRSRSR